MVRATIGFRRMLLFSYHNETLSCSCRLSETLKRQKDTKTSKMGLDSWHQLLFSLMSTEKEWGCLKGEAVGKERNLSEGEEWRFSKKNHQPWTRWCTRSHYTSMKTEKQRESVCESCVSPSLLLSGLWQLFHQLPVILSSREGALRQSEGGKPKAPPKVWLILILTRCLLWKPTRSNPWSSFLNWVLSVIISASLWHKTTGYASEVRKGHLSLCSCPWKLF